MSKIELLEKIKKLAEQGYGGEAENAAALLSRLMKKYNITENELNSDKPTDCRFRYSGKWERRLLSQIIYATTGRPTYRVYNPHTTRPINVLVACCTKAQEIEIKASYDFYNYYLKKDMEIFYEAFIASNDIYWKGEDIKEIANREIDLDRQAKVLLMARSIERHERHLALPE